MKTRNLLPAIGLLALAATPFSNAVSSPVLGYVDLTHTGTHHGVHGGGVQEFKIGTLYDENQNSSGDTTALGNVLKAVQNAQGDGNSGLVYAICTEYDQTLRRQKRYALQQGLAGAPSSTNDINNSEDHYIKQVLTTKFRNSLFDKTASDYATNIGGLQASLWEAGATATSRAGTDNNEPEDDFANGQIDISTAAIGTSHQSTANDWFSEKLLAANVTTYVLIAEGSGQDFAFFVPKEDPSGGDTPMPAPATLLLISLGLLGSRFIKRPA